MADCCLAESRASIGRCREGELAGPDEVERNIGELTTARALRTIMIEQGERGIEVVERWGEENDRKEERIEGFELWTSEVAAMMAGTPGLGVRARRQG